MPMTDENRAAYAADVPVYVEAAEDGTWRVMDTETREALSVEHSSARAALEDARSMLTAKRAVIRSEGEPDGAWRWLDATAVEDSPIGGVRIGERAIWDIASKLNARVSARPINGGELPGDWTPSLPHGDAKSGDGSHPANGWAHSGVPVTDETGRAHLYLWAELLPEIARDVDRGRLAFGSVFIAFDGVDEDDACAVIGAELISHALTNDQAVDPLTAGSERQTNHSDGRAVRTRSLRMATETTTRGPASDKLKELLAALGVDWSDEMEGDEWMSPAIERIRALKQAAVVEEVVEPSPAAGADVAAARAAREGGEEAPEESAEQAAVDGAAALDLLRVMLGKPDASDADALAEASASIEAMASEQGTDVDDDAERAPAAPGEDDADEEDEDESSAGRSVVRERNTARSERDEARAKVARFEMRDRIVKAAADRKLSLTDAKRDRWTDIGIDSGWAMVEELFENLHTPPTGDPMAGARSRGPDPETVLDAVRSMRGVVEEEHAGLEPQQINRLATKRAREAFPHLFNATPVAS